MHNNVKDTSLNALTADHQDCCSYNINKFSLACKLLFGKFYFSLVEEKQALPLSGKGYHQLYKAIVAKLNLFNDPADKCWKVFKTFGTTNKQS